MQRGKENKAHIGIYGRRNNGKSALINCLAAQEVSIVSDVAGTTTDPVKRSFEITGFGPVIFIDTAGIDDFGQLGTLRIKRSTDTLSLIDMAILVITDNRFEEPEIKLVEAFRKQDIPYLIVHNKKDLKPLNLETGKRIQKDTGKMPIDFSTIEADNREELIRSIKNLIPESSWKTPSLFGDLIRYGDIILLITPIDIEAPAGRLILPQVQAIRDILDNDAVAIVLKEREVDSFLKNTGIKPALAVTDSQMFLKADASIPKDIPLTGFSVLLAHLKGDFENYLKGTPKISELQNNDRVLMLESCSHHVSCDDIGRVKIPRWISQFTGKKLHFDTVAGLDKLPRDIHDYALVIQCGGCVITRRQIINRLRPAVEAGIPVTNYGMAIAWVQGIYQRAVAPFVVETDKSDYL